MFYLYNNVSFTIFDFSTISYKSLKLFTFFWGYPVYLFCQKLKSVGLSEVVLESLPESDNFNYFYLIKKRTNVQKRYSHAVWTADEEDYP